MALQAMSLFVAMGLFSNLMFSAHANEFLRPPTQRAFDRISNEDIRVSLLDEVEGSLGAGSASSRLSQMEALLKPIVAALPKNHHGKLGHSAVRYALHRLFVLRHGWVIAGLTAADGAFNSSSPSGVLTNQVPAYIEGLFEQRLAGVGFGLHELAVLASTIEHLIHNEAVGKLGAAFAVHNLPITSSISESEARHVLDTYMIAFILGEPLNNMTLDYALELHEQMPEIFLAWKDTQKFVAGVRENITKGVGPIDFAVLAKVAEEVGEQFGSFQNFECKDLKDKLVKMEYRGTGRVKLSDFYKPALDGAWQFQESSGYLRQLGALDESDPSQPSVLIANYITSQTNCIASSGFYSVCCKNECEDLLSHVEESIGASEAAPATIASLIQGLPSSTVAAPQKLSPNLMQRLEEIAAHHNGKVPLHARLFAQWMHHVYPRECAYPHMSGTANAQKPEEWMVETGTDAAASEEEMLQFTQASSATSRDDVGELRDLPVEELAPWSTEEELFVVRPHDHVDRPASSPAILRSAAILAAAGSMALSLMQVFKVETHVYSDAKYTV